MHCNYKSVGMWMVVAGGLCQAVFLFTGLTRHNFLSVCCTLLILAGVAMYTLDKDNG